MYSLCYVLINSARSLPQHRLAFMKYLNAVERLGGLGCETTVPIYIGSVCKDWIDL